jgi:voltage-gated potassium channel
MPDTETNKSKSELNSFQIVILVLSVYVLFALLYELIFKPTGNIVKILSVFDFIICLVFQYDFFYRFATSKNKLRFLKWGWIDFISSIPTVDILRWGRIIRIFRIFRLLRAFKSTKTIIAYLFKNRAQNTLAIAALITFVLVVFASIAILTFETSPDAHIRSIVDAIWWSFSSVSSTGSGDAFPVSTPGKILAIVLSITGIGLFGTLTAFIARFFIKPDQKGEEDEMGNIRKQLEMLNDKIEKLSNRIKD